MAYELKITENITFNYVNYRHFRGFVSNGKMFTPSQIVKVCQEALKRGLTTQEALKLQFQNVGLLPLDTCQSADLCSVVERLPEIYTLPPYVQLRAELLALRKEVAELRAELKKK